MKQKQSGFTLIEIAIVLVIIGLLLGGVLKGQELINSAKVKNLATDFKNVPIYIYAYQDKYRALPGDDKAADTHLAVSGVTVTITNGDGNGVIGGAWDASSGESFQFWQHIRLAGIAPGTTTTTDNAYIPTNTIGGSIGVTNSSANNPIVGLRGSYIVCSASVPGKFAKQLDIAMDDGNTAAGSMMTAASGTSAATATANIGDDSPYNVCMGF
ncbi:prepilin-type N-terminal cleavage/methylation domain-containing protein [Sideroxyarcus sp. TK5]